MSRIPDISTQEGGVSLMVAWRLPGRRVLVIGGGPVAAGRVQVSLQADADVHVVAPELNAELRVRAERGEITWHERRFEPSDLDYAAMVMACVDDREASYRIVSECRRRRIPVNAADIPEQCDFYFPAVHRDGPVQVAVSTNGQGPALAGRLRDHVAALLPDSVAEATSGFGRFRRRLRAADPAPAGDPRRMAWVRKLGRSWSWRSLARLRPQQMDALIDGYLAGDGPPDEPGHREHGRVQLVGAGPGDPGLLTVAARQAIVEADLVLADRLVTPEILALVGGELRIARKRGRSEQGQDELMQGMLEGALAGKHVVRLKVGDPFLLGRGGEEVAWLAERGVATEVIPGITSAFCAPLAAGIPVTTRGLADRVLVMTGHGKQGSRPRMPTFTQDTTLVLLMAVSRLESLTAELSAQGWPPEWPAALVEKASRPGERVVTGTIGTIAALAREQGVAAPAAFVIGRVVELARATRKARPQTLSIGPRRAIAP